MLCLDNTCVWTKIKGVKVLCEMSQWLAQELKYLSYSKGKQQCPWGTVGASFNVSVMGYYDTITMLPISLSVFISRNNAPQYGQAELGCSWKSLSGSRCFKIKIKCPLPEVSHNSFNRIKMLWLHLYWEWINSHPLCSFKGRTYAA